MASHITQSPDETRILAAQWAASLPAGTVIQLRGDLGAGKTTFVQGMAQGLGCDTVPTSPTFSLLHEYPGKTLTLFHWDLYRLGESTDWNQLDLADQLPGNGITVVEWPERYPGPWPDRVIPIHLRFNGQDNREIQIG